MWLPLRHRVPRCHRHYSISFLLRHAVSGSHGINYLYKGRKRFSEMSESSDLPPYSIIDLNWKAALRFEFCSLLKLRKLSTWNNASLSAFLLAIFRSNSHRYSGSNSSSTRSRMQSCPARRQRLATCQGYPILLVLP